MNDEIESINPMWPTQVLEAIRKPPNPILIQAINSLLPKTMKMRPGTKKSAKFSWNTLRAATARISLEYMPSERDIDLALAAYEEFGWSVFVHEDGGRSETYEFVPQ